MRILKWIVIRVQWFHYFGHWRTTWSVLNNWLGNQVLISKHYYAIASTISFILKRHIVFMMEFFSVHAPNHATSFQRTRGESRKKKKQIQNKFDVHVLFGTITRVNLPSFKKCCVVSYENTFGFGQRIFPIGLLICSHPFFLTLLILMLPFLQHIYRDCLVAQWQVIHCMKSTIMVKGRVASAHTHPFQL